MRNHRMLAFGAAVLSLAVLSAACGNGSGGGGDKTVTVGVSGAYAENQLVAEMYAQVLENAGYTVNRQLDLATRQVSDKALFSGDIDMKPEYLAYELPALDPKADASGTADEVAAKLRPLLEKKGVTMLDFTPANDTNVLVVTPDTASQYNLKTISDLAKVADQLVLGGPAACPENTFCIPAFKKVYGITFKDFKALDEGGPQTVSAVDSGAVDVGLLFSTDPVIQEKGFVVLEDDKSSQPAGNIAPVVRTEVLDAHDDIEGLLDPLSEKITTDNITAAIKEVTVDKKDVADVAKEFLQQQGVLTG
jgi:osmoprotectant transport system substrate-binding protein